MKTTNFALLATLSSFVAALDLTKEVRIEGDEDLWAKASEEVNDMFNFEDENGDNWISYTAATDYIDKGMQAGLLSEEEAIEIWSTI